MEITQNAPGLLGAMRTGSTFALSCIQLVGHHAIKFFVRDALCRGMHRGREFL
jgi:hypothetical protein